LAIDLAHREFVTAFANGAIKLHRKFGIRIGSDIRREREGENGRNYPEEIG